MTIKICDCCKKPVVKDYVDEVDYDDAVEKREFYIARMNGEGVLDLCKTCYASIVNKIYLLQTAKEERE